MISIQHYLHRLTLLHVQPNADACSRQPVIATDKAYHRLIRQIAVAVLVTIAGSGVALHARENPPNENSAAQDLPEPDGTQRPRWEVGLAAAYSWGYDYPASLDTNERGLALPFFVYRAPRFRLGGGGIRAVAIERPRLKLDLSIGGSLNASSAGNSGRADMPDLDFLFEVGPQLAVQLLDRKLESGARLRARFSSELRAVFSTDFGSISARGFVADIGASVNIDKIAGTRIGMIASFTSTFANEELQDYFYEVKPRFVTDVRPAYDAAGGYLESTFFTGIGFQPVPQVRLFAGFIKGFYNGASNEDSPLFETSEQDRYVLGAVWTIKTSKDMVSVVDLGSDN